MKKNYLRAVLSFAVAGMMALSMFTAGTSTVKAEDAKTTWTVSGSKTASSDTLDKNYETQITLSLPAKQEQLKSDVLFVMDISSCAAGTDTVIRNLMNELKDQISKNNASVRVGLVVFKGSATIANELVEYTEENQTKLLDKATKITAAAVKYENYYDDDDMHAEGKKELKALLPDLSLNGTNLPAGLACAKSVLEQSDGVANARKHMILISDGATFLFCNQTQDKTDSTKVVYDYTSHMTRMADAHQAGMDVNQDGTLSEWLVKHPVKSTDKYKSYGDWTPATDSMTWDEYLTKEKDLDSKYNLSQYDQSYYISDSKKIMPVKSSTDKSYESVLNVEKSFFQAADIYKDIQKEGYSCNAYTAGETVAPVFTGFMNYLAGGQAKDITKINNDIFYLLGAGSYITDEMGNADGNNFNFVDNAANLTLTVDGVEYSTSKANASIAGETSRYLFTHAGVTAEEGSDGEAPYVLYYYDGSDGKGERIEWHIYKNVSEIARVQLTYSEKLMNPKTAADTYTGLLTNGTTTLNYVDTNKGSGSETFASPVVQYTILPATDDQPTAAPTVTPTAVPTASPTASTDDRNERPNTPNTGDQTNAPLAAGVLAVALLTCGTVFFFKKKYSN